MTGVLVAYMGFCSFFGNFPQTMSVRVRNIRYIGNKLIEIVDYATGILSRACEDRKGPPATRLRIPLIAFPEKIFLPQPV